MKHAILAAQARWRMLIPIFLLVVGGLMVIAIAYLERSQGVIYEHNLAKMRDLRMVHRDLSSRVLGMDGSEEPERGATVDAHRLEIAQDLAHLGSVIKNAWARPGRRCGCGEQALVRLQPHPDA